MTKYLVFFFLIFLSFSIFSEEFIAATANWIPYAIENEKSGEVFGIGADIIREVCRRTGDAVKLKIFPAERLNQMFDSKKIDINFADSPNWNDVKEDSPFVFSESYSRVVENIYFLKENYIEVRKPEDMKGKTVGIVRGYYYELFNEAFANNVVPFYEVNTEGALFQMLKEKRLYCAFFDNYVFDYLVNRPGYKASDFAKGALLSNSPLGFKVRIEKKEALKKINKAINDMKKDGTIDKIIEKYTTKK